MAGPKSNGLVGSIEIQVGVEAMLRSKYTGQVIQAKNPNRVLCYSFEAKSFLLENLEFSLKAFNCLDEAPSHYGRIIYCTQSLLV